MAEEDNLVALFHGEAHIVKQHGAVFGCGLEILHLQNLVSGLSFHLEDDAGIFACAGTDFFHVEFLKHLLAAGGLLAFCHIGRESADKFLQFLSLFLGFGLLVLGLTQGQLATLIPEAVVSGKHGYLSEVDVYGVGADTVQEVAVVAHHQHGMLKLTQVLLQPLNGFQVKVVGGLVEQQVVGVSEQCLGQHYAYLFLSAQFAHQLVVLVFLDAKSGKQGAGITLGGVASHFGKLVFQFSYADAVLVAEVGLAVQGVAFLHHLPHCGVAHQHGVQNGAVVKLEVVLTQYAQTFAGTQFYGSLGGLKLSADGFEQSGLSGSVRTDDSIDVTTCKLHVHVLVQNAFAKLYGNVG